jgi:hypothetical protein
MPTLTAKQRRDRAHKSRPPVKTLDYSTLKEQMNRLSPTQWNAETSEFAACTMHAGWLSLTPKAVWAWAVEHDVCLITNAPRLNREESPNLLDYMLGYPIPTGFAKMSDYLRDNQ